jgi:L-lactate dehydrogenase complex protein LldG
MSAAREEVLGRIRAALRDVPAAERPRDVGVERSYRRGSDAAAAALRAHFVARASEYRARVLTAPAGEVRAAATAAVRERGARRLVIPSDLRAEWRPGGVELVEDDGHDHATLDRMDGVVTGSAAAIAETGTIVLDAGPGQGRRAITLLPDYHLCVVEVERIVGSVPEALARVAAAVRDSRRPITLISGPSATSDIELERVEGVHGPRTLEILVVG